MFSAFLIFMSLLNSWATAGLAGSCGSEKNRDGAEGMAVLFSHHPCGTGKSCTVNALLTLMWFGGTELISCKLSRRLASSPLALKVGQWAVRARAFPPCLHVQGEAGSCVSLLSHRIGTPYLA